MWLTAALKTKPDKNSQNVGDEKPEKATDCGASENIETTRKNSRAVQASGTNALAQRHKHNAIRLLSAAASGGTRFQHSTGTAAQKIAFARGFMRGFCIIFWSEKSGVIVLNLMCPVFANEKRNTNSIF